MLAVTLEQYENYLYVQLSLKKASYYRALFRRAQIFFKDAEITETSCIEFLKTFNNLSPSGYNNYLKALKKLTNQLGYTFLNSYKLKKAFKPFIQVLDEGELTSLVNEAYRADYRRAVALELYIRSGMRAQELIRLKWADFHGSTIFVRHGKTRSRDFEILSDLETKIEKLRGNDPTYVFATKMGMLHQERLRVFAQRIVKKLKIKKQITLHKLRHSFATLADEKGVSIATLMSILGHTDIRTTQQYIHTTTRQKKEAAKKVSLGQYNLSYEEYVKDIDTYARSLTTPYATTKIVYENKRYFLEIIPLYK